MFRVTKTPISILGVLHIKINKICSNILLKMAKKKYLCRYCENENSCMKTCNCYIKTRE